MRIALHLLAQIDQTIIARVEFRIVNLVRVSQEDKLRTFGRTSNNILDVARFHILRLINNKHSMSNCATTQETNRLNFDVSSLEEFHCLLLQLSICEIRKFRSENLLQIINNTAKIRAHLIVDFTRQKAKFLIANSNSRSSNNNLLIRHSVFVSLLFKGTQSHRQRAVSFASTGNTLHNYQRCNIRRC